MEIASKRLYNNTVHSAIVVNSKTDSDPEGKDRVQIYIPTVHLDWASKYEDYMNSKSKESEVGWNVFPWATTLVDDLVNGNVVYVTNVNNKNDEFVIMGLDVNNIANKKHNSDDGDVDLSDVDTSDILSLTMPIIMLNEVGIAIKDYPNNISNSRYGLITPYDKGCKCVNKATCSHSGGWSIGLIQWHEGRAFDCLYQIAKNDGDWKTRWTSTSFSLYKDIEKAVKAGSSSSYRGSYGASFHPIAGTDLYKSIQNMLCSKSGKETQLKYASKDTNDSITKMTKDYGIDNPAIIIFLADIMNQYGPNLTKTLTNAAKIDKENSDMMKGLEKFRTWCKNNLGSYNDYVTRRNRTYTYIEELYKAGKLTSIGNKKTNLADEKGVDKGGKYLYPAPGCNSISSGFGVKRTYKNTQGQWITDTHKGVDLVDGSGTSAGKKIIAIGNGNVTVAYNDGGYHGGAGNCIFIDHGGGLVSKYMHCQTGSVTVKKGDTVKAGDLIGKIGSTGNVTGPHLHFQIDKNGTPVNPLPYVQKT